MSEPIPTPYDVLPIPEFSWSPTGDSWFVLGLVVLMLVLTLMAPFTLRWWNSRQRHRQIKSIRALLAAPPPTTTDALIVFYRQLRLQLEPVLGGRISQMTPLELRGQATRTNTSRKDILACLAAIGELSYQQTPCLSQLTESTAALQMALNELIAESKLRPKRNREGIPLPQAE